MPVTPKPLTVGVEYTKTELAQLFDAPDLTLVREGWYTRSGNDYVPFFVTLDKASAEPDVAYNDYFDEDRFYWESQNQSTLQSPWIRKILDGAAVPLLFVRQIAKISGKTQPFIYAGRLSNPIVDPASSKPVKFVFEANDLQSNASKELMKLVAWKPSDIHASNHHKFLQREVEKKRKAKSASGQGREEDPRVRKAIELHAMRRATRFYSRRGYTVTDTSAQHPYDLFCEKEGVLARRVEVKGTRGGPESVTVTIGEVLSARERGTISDLFIIHGIVVERLSSNPVASGGNLKLIQNWIPDEKDLHPLTFRYMVPLTPD